MVFYILNSNPSICLPVGRQAQDVTRRSRAPAGVPYQHMTEVTNALNGLRNQLVKLNKLINSGDLGEDVLKAAESLRSQVQKQKDQIQNVLNKAKKELQD